MFPGVTHGRQQNTKPNKRRAYVTQLSRHYVCSNKPWYKQQLWENQDCLLKFQDPEVKRRPLLHFLVSFSRHFALGQYTLEIVLLLYGKKI